MQTENNEDVLRQDDQIVEAFRRQLSRGMNGVEGARETLRKLLKRRSWADRINGDENKRVQYAAFVQFVTDPPLEGLNTTVDRIEELACNDHELRSLLEQAMERSRGGKQSVNRNNVPIEKKKSSGGNDMQKNLRRLRKQRPDLLERVIDGELSPRAALVEAGFRKPTVTIQLDVDSAARTLKRRFSADELAALVAILEAETPE